MKNFILILSLTFGLLTMQSCIKKKVPATAEIKTGAGKQAGAKLTPAQEARQKAARQRKAVKGQTAGKPAGYWPSLRQHLGIEFNQLVKLKNNEGKRVAELAKPGADATTVNTQFDKAAKEIIGEELFAKMQSFTMK